MCNETIETVYQNHIERALLSVRMQMEQVRIIFEEEELRIVDFSDLGIKDRALEVRLDKALILCLFDKQDMCRSVYVTPNEAVDIHHYIAYCVESYPYNYFLKCWMAMDCYILVCNEINEYSLLILPMG